jgi:hypothetical protein
MNDPVLIATIPKNVGVANAFVVNVPVADNVIGLLYDPDDVIDNVPDNEIGPVPDILPAEFNVVDAPIVIVPIRIGFDVFGIVIPPDVAVVIEFEIVAIVEIVKVVEVTVINPVPETPAVNEFTEFIATGALNITAFVP